MTYIAGISIALFISALLINKSNKVIADLFLLTWMLLLAAHLYLYYANFTDSLFAFPQFLGLEIPLPLIHGVMLYLYVAAVTNELPKKRWLLLLHFVPITIGYAYLIPFLLSSHTDKIELFKNGFEGYQAFMKYGLLLIFVSGVVYVIWSSLLLHRHKKNIRNQFSDLDDVNLKWLQFLTYGMGVIWAIVVITNNDTYIFSGVTIFVILIGFFGVQQKAIFLDNNDTLPIDHSKTDKVAETKQKYARSGLNDEKAEALYNQLMVLFKKEGYHKNNDLSLTELANALDTHPNYLSQIINAKEKKSFYDFVNSYRVQEFKQAIADQKHKQFTLLALAYECGFNSKSSLNRHFKKNTGQTPTEYIKSFGT